MNWAAITLVGVFSLMWLGVIIYTDDGSPFWLHAVQIVFGLLLAGWAARKTVWMIGKA
jgi:hypothetical protein